MMNAKANELTEQTFAYYENLIKIQRKDYAEFAKALSPILAAKFMQVERKINAYIDVQMQANIPRGCVCSVPAVISRNGGQVFSLSILLIILILRDIRQRAREKILDKSKVTVYIAYIR